MKINIEIEGKNYNDLLNCLPEINAFLLKNSTKELISGTPPPFVFIQKKIGEGHYKLSINQPQEQQPKRQVVVNVGGLMNHDAEFNVLLEKLKNDMLQNIGRRSQ